MKIKKALPWLAAAGVIAVWIILSVMLRPKVTAYEEHVVVPGDTLWKIAKEYNPDYERIDAVIHEIKKANDMDKSVIYVGTIIKVAVMEK